MNNGPEEIFDDQNSPGMAALNQHLEHQLTRALRPVGLPAGFADRVVAAAQRSQPNDSPIPARGKLLAFPAPRLAAIGAIAASLVVGSFVAEDIHQHREREHERAVATQQFETATRITDEALAHTREQLERAGVPGID